MNTFACRCYHRTSTTALLLAAVLIAGCETAQFAEEARPTNWEMKVASTDSKTMEARVQEAMNAYQAAEDLAPEIQSRASKILDEYREYGWARRKGEVQDTLSPEARHRYALRFMREHEGEAYTPVIKRLIATNRLERMNQGQALPPAAALPYVQIMINANELSPEYRHVAGALERLAEVKPKVAAKYARRALIRYKAFRRYVFRQTMRTNTNVSEETVINKSVNRFLPPEIARRLEAIVDSVD